MQSIPHPGPDVRAPVRLPRGFVLGDYVIDGWLRDGGMASIYRARRAGDDQRVAVKLQLPSTALDPEICARFDQEAAAMRRMSSVPNIVELYDAGVLNDGRRYVAMEWIAGEDLEELLDFLRNRDQRLSVCGVCRIGHEVATGLAALHAQGFVHRDLKPANIMIANEEPGAVKLVDFGLVAPLGEPRGAPRERESRRETLMGTSAYMPPEQLAGAGPETTADIFALGVVLYEALSGHCVPPDGWTPENLPALESLRKNIPVPLARFVRSCMSSDARQRPRSAAEVAHELGRLAASADSEREAAALHPLDPRGQPGQTEVAPRPERAGPHPLVVRTGDTEVALTYDQALSMSLHRRRAQTQPDSPPVAVGTQSDRREVDDEPTTEHVVPERDREAEAQRQGAQTGRGEAREQSQSQSQSQSHPMPRPQPPVRDEDPTTAPQDPPPSTVSPDDHPEESSPATASVDRPGLTDPSATPICEEPAETRRDPAGTASASGSRAAEALPSDLPVHGARPSSRTSADELPKVSFGQTYGAGLAPDGEDSGLVSAAIGDFEQALQSQSRRRKWIAIGLAVAATMIIGVRGLVKLPRRQDQALRPPPEPIVIIPAREEVVSAVASRASVVATAVDPPGDRATRSATAPDDIVHTAHKARSRTRRSRRKERCAKMRQDATVAKTERNWKSLLEHTQKRSCWRGKQNALDRQRLRVEAHAETDDYENCIGEAGNNSDDRITTRVRWCRKKLDQGT